MAGNEELYTEAMTSVSPDALRRMNKRAAKIKATSTSTSWQWAKVPGYHRSHRAHVDGYRFSVQKFDVGARLSYMTPIELLQLQRTGYVPYMPASRRVGISYRSLRDAMKAAPLLLRELNKEARRNDLQLVIPL